MCDWFENEEVDTFFVWEEGDKIENLDNYICNKMRLYGEKYVIKLLADWEVLLLDDDSEVDDENYEIIFRYLKTHMKLYVIEDLWKSFYDDYIYYYRTEGGEFDNILSLILSLFDYNEIKLFLMSIYKQGYTLYNRLLIIGDDSSEISSINYLEKQIRNVLFLIKELVCIEHEELADIIMNFNYNLEKPLDKMLLTPEDYNLLNLAFLLPNYKSKDYAVSFDYLYKINRRFLKRYKKYIIDYYGNMCEHYSYRIKDFYNMSLRRDKKTDSFMLNFTNVMLKLWDDGRKLHQSRIGDIDTKYLYSELSALRGIVNEPTMCSCSYTTIDDMPKKFDFLTECFYLTHRFINLTLYPIIKVYYKIHYKIIELRKSVSHYTSTYGEYENIPILERSIYNRLTNLIKIYVKKEDDLVNILTSKHIRSIIPNMCRDTITILDKMYEDNIMLYKLFPESIFEFIIEYKLFIYTALKAKLPETTFCGLFEFFESCGNFIVKSMSDTDRISNPYLRYKCFDLISISKESSEAILQFVMCKRAILENSIKLFIDAEKISTPHLMRDRVNFFLIKALGFHNDYSYTFSILEDNSNCLVEFLYLESSEMIYNFEIIIKNLNSIYNIRDLNDNGSVILKSDYKYKVINSFVYLLNSLSLCKLLLVLPPPSTISELFYKREIIDKFINFIYFVFKKSHDFKDMLDYFSDYPLGEKSLLERFNLLYKNCFNIYNKLSKNEMLIKIAGSSDSFFDRDVMLKYLENALTLGLVDWIRHDEILETINEVHKKIQEYSLDDREIPDEFLDPIMSTLIEEPIMLPETDVIMDINVISTHLLNNKINPFTRTPLTMEELREYNKRDEVIKRVEDFRQKLINWKEAK